jgi:glucose/arabinose dehydrogenase
MFPGRFLGALAAAAILALPLSAEIRLATTRVASGLSKPLFVTAPPRDTSRLFIVEQGTNGTAEIKILDLESNTILSRSFLSIPGISVNGERGLLGLAFHPDYAQNGYFYVYVSDTDTSETVRRYQVSTLANVADPASGKNVMVMPDNFPNHNGGWIGFGPDDGYLYIATGDGMDPQNPQNYFGKILRIDVDGDDFPGDPNRNYAIPPTNPFVAQGAGTIFDVGLRNPWRDSFDRATGDLYIGDVGWTNYEEIDVQPAGQSAVNFGWECMEGPMCSGNGTCTCNAPSLTDPIVSYGHNMGCAIVGGLRLPRTGAVRAPGHVLLRRLLLEPDLVLGAGRTASRRTYASARPSSSPPRRSRSR